MRVLIVAEKKAQAQPFMDAFTERGVRARYIRVSRISLISVKNKTLIKSRGEELPRFDSVLFQVRPSLAPFIEPFIEALKAKESFVSAEEGAYYAAFNEALQAVVLAQNDIPTPKTLISGSGKNIERVSTKISYPLIAKSFIGKAVQQSIVVNTDKELNSFVNSIKSGVDGFILKEFIEGDVVSCAVIGDKVFAVKRKYKNQSVADIERGMTYKLTENEKEVALRAIKACGFELARVDMVKGKVLKIDPIIPLEGFNKVCSDNMEEKVAAFLIEKMELIGPKVSIVDDIKEIKSIFSRTVIGKIFK